MPEYQISTRRKDAHGSVEQCRQAEIIMDTLVDGRTDAFNPAELLLTARKAISEYPWVRNNTGNGNRITISG